MNWLQNIVILVSGFLLSQVLIATKTHHKAIAYLLDHGRATAGGLVGTTLMLSYGLSMFFSNTVVVLAMLPVVRKLLSLVRDTQQIRTIGALFYCALIFGANTGGMASITGNALNIAAAGLADFHGLPGANRVTFFSWLVIGVPATSILAFAAWKLLMAHLPPGAEELLTERKGKESRRLPKKPLIFFIGNIFLMFIMSAGQSFIAPPAILGNLNVLDIAFLTYLTGLLFFCFIIPRKSLDWRSILKNIVFLFFFIVSFPVLCVARTLEQTEKRLHVPLHGLHETFDRILLLMFNGIWKPLFGESFRSLSIYNFNSVLSINLIMRDIPYFGLVLMGAAAALLLSLISLGDNPSTPEIDGILFTALGDAGSGLLASFKSPAVLFGVLSISTIFLTEIFNNTTILLVLAPAILDTTPAFAAEPLILLLLVTVTASGAFMSPLATPVNALAFGGMENLSLKTILRLGFLMNVIGAAWATVLFLLLSALL
ncbi:hypothetical protein CHL67_06540 [Prosthecochloris sp. GSB1]|uniref:SLC13 family permease n=1 Tax=Prosthecochloris sp. GSB1 TaxID=281093 RepID=UPI000B8C7087|nr:SLC13 family permease [Prosthecochloris sp. GSB1]ASQ90627.1 hypothetical protein CHL67_06540 [Prosthecochloris sp. GSB1]